jgi:hypothetical protein
MTSIGDSMRVVNAAPTRKETLRRALGLAADILAFRLTASRISDRVPLPTWACL